MEVPAPQLRLDKAGCPWCPLQAGEGSSEQRWHPTKKQVSGGGHPRAVAQAALGAHGGLGARPAPARLTPARRPRGGRAVPVGVLHAVGHVFLSGCVGQVAGASVWTSGSSLCPLARPLLPGCLRAARRPSRGSRCCLCTCAECVEAAGESGQQGDGCQLGGQEGSPLGA